MGRPKIYPVRVSTNVRFPLPLHGRLKDEVERRDASVSLLVTKACEEFLLKYGR